MNDAKILLEKTTFDRKSMSNEELIVPITIDSKSSSKRHKKSKTHKTYKVYKKQKSSASKTKSRSRAKYQRL